MAGEMEKDSVFQQLQISLNRLIPTFKEDLRPLRGLKHFTTQIYGLTDISYEEGLRSLPDARVNSEV